MDKVATWIRIRGLLAAISTIATSIPAEADAAGVSVHSAQLTHHWVGWVSLVVFCIAYLVVMAEEFTQLRKSKPVIFASGIIWGLVGGYSVMHGQAEAAESALRHNILEYAELMLFLLVAMTYINAMEERGVFDALRAWLIRKGFGLRKLFWLTGFLAFFISPVADNLTTALLMCAVVLAVGGNNPRFVVPSCVNIVVGANAGGAFSPFGDITTLMVWQKGIVEFWTFFRLFVPALVNFLVPALFMHFAVPDALPTVADERVRMKPGARRILLLFLATIVTAVSFHNFLGLPPMVGMMTGLAYLQFFGYFLKNRARRRRANGEYGDPVPFDVFQRIAHAEWDTLLFFYGVVLCVGGLGYIGYLALASEVMYGHWSATLANTVVGLLSSVVDNIPVMYAVLSMHPDMPTGQWLLVTLTAGVGGSLLSIGSAAGVALMGQARGVYTFFSHLRWTPAIALGYAASIFVHLWLDAHFF
ncbi:MAG: sodium:proton antiporter [Gammaproteobacteria bacterium]|nr:MAG: sodium:proton antiporter [Gammaproteobacteria bacterium]